MKHLESEFNSENYRYMSNKDISYLKKKAIKSKRGRYRLCLHNNTSHKTQEMFICLKKKSYFQPHKHPSKYSESYFMIEGAIDVYLMDNKGNIFEKIELYDNKRTKSLTNFYYRLSSSIYHFVVPRSNWAIYHEVSTGPFIKAKNVIYGKFAPSEEKSHKEIKLYVNKLLGKESPYK